MRVPVFEKLARTFKLGKWKHFRGYDLDGNRYFEIPGGPHGLPKRTVDYRVKREWSDYQFYQMPVQWSAWMRRTRKEPPGIEELQRDHDRQARLKINVAELERQYREEKAAQLAEAEKVAQIDAPMRKPAQEAGRYPSQDNPAMVPTSMAGTHPPSQEAGASVPRERPDDASFPSVAQGTPERQQMAAALDEVADMNLGKEEKERQLAGGAPQAPEQPGQAAKPADDFKPEEWKPVSRRR